MSCLVRDFILLNLVNHADRFSKACVSLTRQHLQNWSGSGQTLSLVLYKYGMALATQAQFTAFESAVLRPQQVDRAGEAAEEAHQEMVQRLRDFHGGVYAGAAINWRIWAAAILAMPRPQQANAIEQPPPANLIRMFSRAPGNAEQRMEQMRQTTVLTSNFLQDTTLQVTDLEDAFKDVQVQVRVGFADLERRLELIKICSEDATISARRIPGSYLTLRAPQWRKHYARNAICDGFGSSIKHPKWTGERDTSTIP
jgi:hypothetical protein